MPKGKPKNVLNFRHLLEEHNLGEKLFHKINKHLEKKGLSFKEGTIMDASIIDAPSSTRNQSGARDPEMHQTQKGNQWHFGMKVHVGVDVFSRIKNQFGYGKVRYRGLHKNTNRLYLLAGLPICCT